MKIQVQVWDPDYRLRGRLFDIGASMALVFSIGFIVAVML